MALRFTHEQYEAYERRRVTRIGKLPIDGDVEIVRLGDIGHTEVDSAKISRRKYGNMPTDGYDSKREAKRAAELKLMEKAGEIRDLREQVEYELIPAQVLDGKCVERAVTWKCDFQYIDVATGILAVEDCKGYANDRWPIKRKLMLHRYGIRVREV